MRIDGNSREQRAGATCGGKTLPVVGIHLVVFMLYCTCLLVSTCAVLYIQLLSVIVARTPAHVY